MLKNGLVICALPSRLPACMKTGDVSAVATSYSVSSFTAQRSNGSEISERNLVFYQQIYNGTAIKSMHNWSVKHTDINWCRGCLPQQSREYWLVSVWQMLFNEDGERMFVLPEVWCIKIQTQLSLIHNWKWWVFYGLRGPWSAKYGSCLYGTNNRGPVFWSSS